ncbi:phd finger protein, putative, partial [Hepatocystis sp. ex Piliocolobus tephrosceles]
MDECVKLVEEYISPEQVMLHYGKEKKVELIYEKNKDKEENKIRNEIVNKLVVLIKNDAEATEKISECVRDLVSLSSKTDIYMNSSGEMEKTNKINKIGQSDKYKKLIEIIIILQKYFFCNENLKRGSAVHLLAQLFERLDLYDLNIEYYKAIIFFFVKKIKDWHCVNGVVNFFFIMLNKYSDIIKIIKYDSMCFSPEYKKLFMVKKSSVKHINVFNLEKKESLNCVNFINNNNGNNNNGNNNNGNNNNGNGVMCGSDVMDCCLKSGETDVKSELNNLSNMNLVVDHNKNENNNNY